MPSTDQRNEQSKSAPVATIAFKSPEWLTAELFDKLLKDIVPNYRKITHFEAKPALAPGENYATVMLRVNIDVQLEDGAKKSLSYMMKIPTENEIFKQMMRNHNIFEIEYRMYHELLPEFEQLYADVGAEVNFSAKCYIMKTPSEFGVILLEDLRPFGYKNANRLEGLDIVQTKAVLVRLAQWHAASAMRVETKGLYPELFIRGWFTEPQRDSYQTYGVSIKAPFLDAVKAAEGAEEYIDSVGYSFDQLQTTLFDVPSNTNEFKVLNHGDCWTNNIMFKYDSEGNIKDTLLIDYQMVNYGTPAKDLHYLFLSSTSYDVKVQHFDYLIKFYHDNLAKNLKLLKYPKKLPTLKEIHIAMLENAQWALSTIISVTPVALLDPTKDANIDGFFGDSDDTVRFKNTVFQNPRYRKHLGIVMPFLNNRGAFEA